MADIASIGFSANTSDLVDAKLSLDQLSPAAGRAERAVDRLNKMMEAGQRSAMAAAKADLAKANAVLSAARASDNGTRAETAAAASEQRKAKAAYDAAKASYAQTQASNEAAAAARKEAAALEAAASAARKRNGVPTNPATPTTPTTPANPTTPTPANSNKPISDGAFKANVSNIAAQFQDIGVTAAMGMNPMLIALQQGTQLSMALGGGLKSVGAAFLTLLSPLSLGVIGLVAVAAALIEMVNWIKVAQTGLNFLASIMPQLAMTAAVVGTVLAIAFAPAIATTIWSIASAITLGLMEAILGIVAAIGSVPILIGAVIAAFFIFRDDITNILGVDIVGAAKTGVNYIIGSFVAAYHDIEFLWKQFPNVIGAAAIGAANLIIKAVNAIVSATVKGINVLIAALDKIGSSSIMQKIGLNFEIGQYAEGFGQTQEIANTFADGMTKAAAGRNKQLQDDLSKDYLSAFGGAINTAAKSAATKIKEFSANLGKTKDKKSGGGGKTDAEKYDDIINGAERNVAKLQAERDAIGLSELATAKLKYETQYLNEAKQKNIELSDPQRAKLLELADSMAVLEVETKKAKDALEFSKSTTKSFLSDLYTGLRDGKSLWESFGNAVNNVIDKIVDKLLNNLVDAIFTVNSSTGKSSGAGGFLSTIFSWFANAKGNAFGTGGVQAYAKGGTFTNSVVSSPTMFAFANGGKFGVMGEAGPEAILPLKRGSDGSLGVQMHGKTGGGNTTSNVITIAPVIQVSGSSGNTADDQKQAAKISESVTDAINKIVDERMLANTVYGGVMKPRGYNN